MVCLKSESYGALIRRLIASEPFPVISGLGAENFQEELETMEYPENIKSIYKNSRELVRKLGLFP